MYNRSDARFTEKATTLNMRLLREDETFVDIDRQFQLADHGIKDPLFVFRIDCFAMPTISTHSCYRCVECSRLIKSSLKSMSLQFNTFLLLYVL